MGQKKDSILGLLIELAGVLIYITLFLLIAIAAAVIV